MSPGKPLVSDSTVAPSCSLRNVTSVRTQSARLRCRGVRMRPAVLPTRPRCHRRPKTCARRCQERCLWRHKETTSGQWHYAQRRIARFGARFGVPEPRRPVCPSESSAAVVPQVAWAAGGVRIPAWRSRELTKFGRRYCSATANPAMSPGFKAITLGGWTRSSRCLSDGRATDSEVAKSARPGHDVSGAARARAPRSTWPPSRSGRSTPRR